MMKKWLCKENMLLLLGCGLLAVEGLLLADFAVVVNGGALRASTLILLWPVVTLALCVLLRRCGKRPLRAALLIPAVLCAACALGYAGWWFFQGEAAYADPDAGKYQMYGERDVMVIVPHEDDEYNILGGVMEEYVRYESCLRVVFVTNGDYHGSAETRFSEAIAAMESIGVPEEQVIFLGYGDQWSEEGPHIYNAEPGQTLTSHSGRTQTYGTQTHSAYREGRAYTIDNLMEDMAAVILEYRPDVLVCSDYDHHIDHKMTSLLFDRVMGNVLKENPDYAPTVYKAYAYGTAWEAERDYYADNVPSTRDLFAEPYEQRPAVYRWEDRVRLPVAGDTLSRSLLGSRGYATLSLHKSQAAGLFADRVLNGDKVVWQRNTTSPVLHGTVSASSGRAELLNDFMLVDSYDLKNSGDRPYDGVWIPEDTDGERTVTVTLEQATDIASVVLYDHPDGERNVLNAVVSFSDGTETETGPLDPGGAATVIPVEGKDISWFTVTLAQTEGDGAGLSEIEAYTREPETDGRFIKLMDGEGNFLYDYLTDPEGTAELSLYLHGELPEVTAENYTVAVAWDAGEAELDGDVIRVCCPAGETMVLTVTCDTAGVSDSITLRNPGQLSRWWLRLWMDAEKTVYGWQVEGVLDNVLDNLYLPSLLEKLSYVIRHI